MKYMNEFSANLSKEFKNNSTEDKNDDICRYSSQEDEDSQYVDEILIA